MSTKFFVKNDGAYIGGFDGVMPPAGSIEVPTAPSDARQVWDGEAWGEIPVAIPDRVTANQFGKQLAALGLLDQVTTWVGQQSASVQWSFNRSATFVRDDPMMEAGFAALNFTDQQIDEFFIAAAALS
jgi:hypothetical protein